MKERWIRIKESHLKILLFHAEHNIRSNVLQNKDDLTIKGCHILEIEKKKLTDEVAKEK